MKKIIIIVVGLLLLGIAGAMFLYHKPHQDISQADPDYIMTSPELFAAFETDEASANEKYLDKIIQISGKVASTTTDEEGQMSITLEGDGLMFGVICKLDGLSEPKRKDFSQGEEIRLKGICSGMLMDVVLVRCVEV